jgi:TRAP-type mannitol/chloroaromatic compound transport system permease small subunit
MVVLAVIGFFILIFAGISKMLSNVANSTSQDDEDFDDWYNNIKK